MFQHVEVDFFGPFPDSSAGNRCIAVAVDYAARYAVARPLLTGTAVDITEFLLHKVILKYGVPRVLIFGRGHPFVSRVLAEIFCASAP